MPASVMEDIWLGTESKTALYNAGAGQHLELGAVTLPPADR